MAHPRVEADKMLDVYIYDYFQKKKLSASARAFLAEAQVPTNIKAFDAPGGFLPEWWSVFWDIFIARYKHPRQGTAGSNIATQLNEVHEPYMLQQMQQFILQKHIEQQRQQKEQTNMMQVQNETANALRRQNLGLTHESAKRIQQRSTNPPLQKDLMADMKIVYGNHYSVPESVASRNSVIDPRLALGGVPPGNMVAFNSMIEQSHQHPVPQDLRSLMNPLPNFRTASSDGLLYGVAESNQAVDKLPLRGWPLMGLDRLQAGILQKQKSLLLSSQQRHMQQQLQLLHNLQSNANVPKETQSSSGGSCIPDHSLQAQVGRPILSGGDAELLAEVSNNSVMRKRKQPMSSSDPTNSPEKSKTPSLPADSAPSPHTADAVAMPTLTHDDTVEGRTCGAPCKLTSSHTQLALVGDPTIIKSVDSNVELLPHDSSSTQCVEKNNEFTFSQIGRIHVRPFNCLDLSPYGGIIATGCLDKKVVLWGTSVKEPKFANEEHSDVITDIRFSSRLPRMATSSLDKTIKIWDIDNLSNSCRTFTGHSDPVMSVDFHPNKEDLICSCDDVTAIRYWSIRDDGCAGVSKGAAIQVRFQPTYGRYLAAAVGNGVSMIDVETTQASRYPFKQCHESKVRSVCWNAYGDYMASMSEDLVKVWKIGSGEMKECIHELSISRKKIRCCVFHPCYPSLMVIGLEQSLKLWHMAEGKTMTMLGDPTTALAASVHAGLIASASDGNSIRLWK